MAKNKAGAKQPVGKPSKSQFIRDYFAADPTASNTEVVAALAEQGLTVTPEFVAQIKSKAKSRQAAEVKKVPAAKKKAPAASAPAANVSADAIVQAARFIQSVGGVANAREALKAAEQVANVLQANSAP